MGYGWRDVHDAESNAVVQQQRGVLSIYQLFIVDKIRFCSGSPGAGHATPEWNLIVPTGQRLLLIS